MSMFIFFIFFFQAEAGIRDGHVTGVQTCALPIFQVESLPLRALARFGAKLRASSSRQPSSSERPKEVCQLRAANVAAAGAENVETFIHALSPFWLSAP